MRKFCINKKSHDHGTDQSDRCADAHAQDHLISHLDVGDICGQSCDKLCGAEFVNIGERECLDIFITLPFLSCGQTGRGSHRIFPHHTCKKRHKAVTIIRPPIT